MAASVEQHAELRRRLHGLHHGQCRPAGHLAASSASSSTMFGVFQVNTWVAFFAAIGVILSAAYALWLYRRVIFGALTKESLEGHPRSRRRENAILYPLIVLDHLLRLSTRRRSSTRPPPRSRRSSNNYRCMPSAAATMAAGGALTDVGTMTPEPSTSASRLARPPELILARRRDGAADDRRLFGERAPYVVTGSPVHRC